MTHDPSRPTPGSHLIVWSAIFLAVAVALIANGFWVMHSYDRSGASGPVGADAYNYIIWASRGTGWICAGIGSGVVAIGLGTIAVWRRIGSLR